jgi:hypothetical protein
MSGDWTARGWFQMKSYVGANAATYNVFSMDDATVGILLATDAAGTAMNWYTWDGANAVTGTAFATGSDTGWHYAAISHASGATSYNAYWRKDGATSLSTSSLATGTQLTAPNKIWLGSDGFGEAVTNAAWRSWTISASLLTSAQLLAESQSLLQPAGSNLHFLASIGSASAGTNGGTGGAWAVNGTLASDEPTEPEAGLFPGVIDTASYRICRNTLLRL